MKRYYLTPLFLMIFLIIFTIPAQAETQDLSITFPLGGENMAVGSLQTITWDGYRDYELDLFLSTNSGRTYDIYLGSGIAGAFRWTVPDITTDHARIKIAGEIPYLTRAPVSVEAVSDADFAIGRVPDAPTGLGAMALSPSEMQLLWTVNSDNEQGFSIERNRREVVTVGPGAQGGIDDGLLVDTEYSYRVRAYNVFGYSDYSNEITVVTPQDDQSEPPDLSDNAIIIRLGIDRTEYYVDDERKVMDVAPRLEENRTLLPIRYVAEPLGAFVSWNPLSRKVTVTLDGGVVELWIGESRARVNGVERFIDENNPKVMPIIVPPGRTMLPLRFIAESLGAEVDWEPQDQKVTVAYDPGSEWVGERMVLRPDCSEVVITFEDFAHGTDIFNQYGGIGITFPNVPSIMELEGVDLPSGNRALGTSRPGEEFGGKLVIEFTTGQTCVSLFAGLLDDTGENKVLATLEAFDAGEIVVIPGWGMEVYPPKQVAIQQGLLGPGPEGRFRRMTVETEGVPQIYRVALSYEGGYFPIIDDLRVSVIGEALVEFETRPRATIDIPSDATVISGFAPHSGAIDLMGTVHEEFKLKKVTYTAMNEERNLSGELPFTGEAPSYAFGGVNLHGLILPGENRIRVTPYSWSASTNILQSDSVTVHLEALLEDGDEAELLILTADEFYHSLIPLRDWKNATGISTHIMTLSSIEQDERFSGSRDITERVKRAIAHAYLHHDTRYVMLVGDGDRFPVRYFKTGRDGVSWGVVYPITDLYYACLFKPDGTFDDWDGNQNGIIGEWWAPPIDGGLAENFAQMNIDDCSLKPDVALGRVPASTVEEVSAYVNKVIEYESMSSPSYENIVLWNATSDFRNDDQALNSVAADLLPDFSAKKHYRPAGYSTWSSEERNQYRASWRQGLLDDINEGATFAIFYGHGERTAMGVLRERDIQGLTNVGRYPVFIASACDTAKFVHEHDIYVDVDGNYPPCWPSCPPLQGDTWPGPNPEPAPIQPSHLDVDSMAEALLLTPEAGAIGFLGARSGTNDASHPFANLFIDAYNTEQGMRLGEMWVSGVTAFVETYLETDHWFGRSNLMSRHIHIFVLFGDPSLRLKRP